MIWMPAEHMLAQRASADLHERLNDSNSGVLVGTIWAIGRTPHFTTPLQLSDALWKWSGVVGTPWKVILLGAERPPPALELTLPRAKVFLRAEMTGQGERERTSGT